MMVFIGLILTIVGLYILHPFRNIGDILIPVLCFSYFWIFHIILLIQYYIKDYQKNIIIRGSKITIIKKKSVRELNLEKDVKDIIFVDRMKLHKDPFKEFKFIKMILSSGENIYITSLSGNINELVSRTDLKIKEEKVFYPILK